MGQQIIQQPDGLYAIWSSVVDAFVLIDATPQDIVEHWTQEARERFTDHVSQVIADLATGRRPYHQFTMTWADALERSNAVHGKPFDLDEARNAPESSEKPST